MNKKTAKGLVEHAKQWVGRPYWYGTCCYECTPSLLARKKKQYASHYTSKRMPRYEQDIKDKKWSADCIGLIKGYYWFDEEKQKGVYGLDGRPDVSANGMFRTAKEYGPIDTMPDIPGLLVRYDGHIGIYIGKGEVIEARGFDYGIVKTKLKSRKWTHWMKCPFIDYGNELEEQPEDTTPDLEIGSKGPIVGKMQERLIAHGVTLPQYGADNHFGKETLGGVKAFQKLKNLPITGIVDDPTWEALLAEPVIPEEVIYTVSIPNLTPTDLEFLRATYADVRVTESSLKSYKDRVSGV